MHDDFSAYLAEKRRLVESYLSTHFTVHITSKKLNDSMRYSLEAGGKRLRPILALASFEAAGGKDANVVLPIAAALECIHTYSLVHDDLPAMDDDDLRRGKPTNHKVYGEATAILAGDGLLTEAFYLIASAGKALSPAAVLSIIRRVADASGCRGMVGGQQFDMDHQNQTPTLPILERIHTHKTGRLLTVAVEVGALAAGIREAELKPFTTYGYNLGYAFQIIDDVLDVTATAEELGKTAKSDLKHNKATFVSLLGVDESKQRAETMIASAIAAVRPLGERAQALIHLANYITSRKN